MSQVQAELARLKDEAQRTLATVIAESILSAQAELAKANRTSDGIKKKLEQLQGLNIVDREAVERYYGYSTPMFQLGDKTINLRELLDRI